MRLGDPKRRLRAALVLSLLVLTLFVGRLVQVQGLEADRYAAQAKAQRLQTVTLQSARGTVTDRHGVPLATSVETRTVTADPSLVTDPTGTAAQLSPLLGVSEADLVRRLSRDGRYVVLARDVSPERWQQVEALGLRGIFSEPDSRRSYPSGSVASNALGFVGADGHGLAGLELQLDDVLAGQDGRLIYEAGLGRQIPTTTTVDEEPVAGSDVRLTLDRDIQWTAERSLAKKVKETGAESGDVVVMDAKSGEILALATAPGFDPAEPGAVEESQRRNRPVVDAYEPGSTGKVITAAALLEEGAVTPSTQFSVPGRLERGGKTFKDYWDHGTLNLTYAGTLAKSSNIGTILAAERLGLERLYPYFRDFGIGQPSGLGFPGETAGSLPAPESWSKTTGYTMTFGQGYSATSLQMASVYATLANDGVRVEPTLVQAVKDSGGEFRRAGEPDRRRVVSARTARTLTGMLEAVTAEGGTAPDVQIPGYRVAGKTGTAQRYDAGCGCYRGYTMSFAGYAPADDPEIVVSVSLQAPKRGAGGGATAGPVFKEVMSFALKSRGVSPTGTTAPPMKLEWK